jgi:large subunit ribosomal protein L18
MKTISRNNLRLQRKKRIRYKMSGTAKTPRLCVFRSLKNIYAQAINDDLGVILVSAKLEKKDKNDMQGAKKVGLSIAKKCKDMKIEKVVFDRSGYKYHGKIKAVADGAREGGLKF